MFSGIVEEVGEIAAVEKIADGRRLTVRSEHLLSDAKMGESISVSGVCLTVVEFSKKSFVVEAVKETLDKTTIGELAVGDPVNLEKALKVSDRLGGHLVSGHVDCVASVKSIELQGVSKLIKFSLPSFWSPYFVQKGSVTVAGVSLTVVECPPISPDSCNAVDGGGFWFSVALIPHTLAVTTLGRLRVSDRVNIETDLIARYVIRLLGDSYLEMLNKERESLLIHENEG